MVAQFDPTFGLAAFDPTNLGQYFHFIVIVLILIHLSGWLALNFMFRVSLSICYAKLFLKTPVKIGLYSFHLECIWRKSLVYNPKTLTSRKLYCKQLFCSTFHSVSLPYNLINKIIQYLIELAELYLCGGLETNSHFLSFF